MAGTIEHGDDTHNRRASGAAGRCAALLLVALTSGCATLTQPSTQEIRVVTLDSRDRPIDGLRCTASNATGEIPFSSPAAQISVRRSGTPLELACTGTRDGAELSARGTVTPRRDGVEQALVPFGSVAVAIDHLSGKLYSYPTKIRLRLGQHLTFEHSEEGRSTGVVAELGKTQLAEPAPIAPAAVAAAPAVTPQAAAAPRPAARPARATTTAPTPGLATARSPNAPAATTTAATQPARATSSGARVPAGGTAAGQNTAAASAPRPAAVAAASAAPSQPALSTTTPGSAPGTRANTPPGTATSTATSTAAARPSAAAAGAAATGSVRIATP
jgi:hypothetical protein